MVGRATLGAFCIALALLARIDGIIRATAQTSDEGECSVDETNRRRATPAFKNLYQVFSHPRCANCHGAINVFDENTDHAGGARVDIVEQPAGGEDLFSFGEATEAERVVIPQDAQSCITCHDAADGEWIQRANPGSEIQWAGLDERALWRRLKQTRVIVDRDIRDTRDSTGQLLIDHAAHDILIDLAFQGRRGMSEDSYLETFGFPDPEPPTNLRSQRQQPGSGIAVSPPPFTAHARFHPAEPGSPWKIG